MVEYFQVMHCCTFVHHEQRLLAGVLVPMPIISDTYVGHVMRWAMRRLQLVTQPSGVL